MGVLMFSSLMRLEATTQYAVDQVAKEVSQYYYVIEKTGLLPDQPETLSVENADELIGKSEETISGLSTLMGDVSSGADAGTIVSDVESLGQNTDAIYNTIKSTDWKTEITNVLRLTVKSAADKAFGKIVAGPVCKMLFEKYIPADDADEFFKNHGVENGMADLDFTYSTFIQDGFSINVVLVYKLNLKDLTFGMFDKDIYIKQVGSTQAWVHYKNKKNTEATFWDIESWGDRGETGIAQLENQYGDSVDPGVGFDAYDSSTGTLTELHTIDLYDTNCIDKDGKLDEKKFKQRLQGYANITRHDLDKVKEGKVIKVNGQEVTLTGKEKHQLVIVLPEEAKKDYGTQIENIKSQLGDYSLDGIIIEYKEKGKN